jgi:hypothetical protein
MTADLSKEQVEELIGELRAKAHASTRHKVRHRTPTPVQQHVCWRAAEALLTLARSAPSPELVALGEAAVKFWDADKLALGPIDRAASIGLHMAGNDLQSAARTFARTVEGERNGR